MLESLQQAVSWIFGETNEQQLAKLRNYLDEVNSYADEMAALSDEELRNKTSEFKAELRSGKEQEEILPEAFATVREIAERRTNMRPYDVQILGAVALYQGRIAEMQTGEGKTLVATMPAYLKALQGQVHIATVNDYLAQRDREWMGPIYESLGLEVGALQEDMEIDARKSVYEADVIYGTAAQFGFDYLRDNMVTSTDQRVQPNRNYAIVDEIDSILIDEARTPLIISGSAEESTSLYRRFARLQNKFQKGEHYELDEENQQVTLTDEGANKAETLLKLDDIYSPENIDLLHHLKLSLRASNFFHKDEDYIVKDGNIVIVDEFTGRLMPDRRYSEGLHQALEAKEGMLVRKENQTLAQITLQNYFMLYDRISGMTGTAKTEEEEFEEIYGLDVVVIPTNRPLRRDNKPDVIFKTKKAKYNAIVEEIERLHELERPVLVGTNAIEKSEKISSMLQKRNLDHEVLNAKQHAREAEIIKEAGQSGSITIATNMAGRGTDIKLGEGVADLGGLHVLGAQRHESRRIDNQLRGRAGRQGDPGSSQFYLSLEDDLLRIFGGDRLNSLMDRVGMEEGQAIENQLLTKSIRRAQKKVEGINFERRKQVLKYDRVMAKQREAIYSLRDNFILNAEQEQNWEEIDKYFQDIIEEYTSDLLDDHCPKDVPSDEWDMDGLRETLRKFDNVTWQEEGFPSKRKPLNDLVLSFIQENWNQQLKRLQDEEEITPELFKSIVLRLIDQNWRQHLYLIDDLKEGIGWTSYGGSDPLVEFKRESFRLFQDLLERIREEAVQYLLQPRITIKGEGTRKRAQIETSNLQYQHETIDSSLEQRSGGQSPESQGTRNSQDRKTKGTQQQRIVEEEPGRNDPCPCGSGKKYKYCCGRD